MIYNYTKTVSVERLIWEIKLSSISTTLVCINAFGDAIDIDFASSLSTTDNDTLDTIITNHANNPIPAPVTPRQLRLTLLSQGITSDDIIAQLNTLSEPTKTQALIQWDYSIDFDRTDPLVCQIGDALGLTPSQMDDMWIAAGEL
jgi:hypothetical protein